MSSDQPLEVVPLTEAHFGLDGGAMFGIIPRPLWERTNPADANNRIAMTCRCVLVRYADKNVLIDTGIGTKWSSKEQKIYNIHRQDRAFKQALTSLQLDVADIDEVIFTHLHFDHAGGASWNDDHGVIRPTFPAARHWVQKRNWSWAHAPSARDSGSYRRSDFSFFETDPNAPELVLVDGIREILPGIEVIPVHGHTFGMQLVRITTNKNIYLFAADLIPTTSHLKDAYVMGYDLQPLQTVEEKHAILYEAIKDDWIIIFSHDPITHFARIERDKKGQPQAVKSVVEQGN